MTEQKYIELLRKEIESKLAWGRASEWHSSMFTELSQLIYDKNQIQLSASTLKRFMGVINHQGKPSISTLDTLCDFCGFTNWREFKLTHPPKKQPRSFRLRDVKSPFYIGLGFIIAVFTFSILSSRGVPEPEPFDPVPFSSRPITQGMPNSVVFDFDLEGIQSDSLYIQQYWDATKTIKLKPGQNQATGIYYFPGYFRAKLLIEGQSVGEHDLFIKSDGWIGTIDYAPVPKYLDKSQILNTGLQFPSEYIEELHELEEPVTTTFHYINDLGEVSGDHFSLDFKVKNVFREKWAVCQTTWVYFIGSSGAMIVPFSIPGCSSDNGLMLNDVFISGKEKDLSSLTTDMSELQAFNIKIVDKEVFISINDTEVYKARYYSSMGKLVGLRFKFKGAGDVEDIVLKDELDKEIFLDL